MEDVLEHQRTKLLNISNVTEYLKEVAPIDYMLEFKNMLYNPELPIQYKELNDDLEHIRLTINDEIDIRKRYCTKIEGTGDDISSVEFVKFEDEELGLLAWGWYAITPFSKQIPSSDVNRGLRLRKRNIQIGTSKLLNEYFKEPRGNNYFYGEIHAVHSNLKPNSSRDGLTQTQESIRLYEMLGEYFSDLQKLYYLANETKNIARDIALAATTVPKDDAEKAELKKKIESSLDKLGKAKEKVANGKISDASKKILNIYEGGIQESLGKLPSDIVSDITHEKKTNDTYTEGTIVSEPIVSTSKATPTITDIFEPLSKRYKPSEIKLMRKIFAVLAQNCPPSQRPMFETMKEKALKQLNK